MLGAFAEDLNVNKYEVKREHLGEKYYVEGEIREANPANVKHLVDKGILVEHVEDAKPKATKNTVKQAKPE